MIADIIAEALAAAEAATEEDLDDGPFPRVSVLADSVKERGCEGRAESIFFDAEPGQCRYLRADVVEAALAHLAAQIDILTKRSAAVSGALGAVYEIAAASDPADAAWAYVFTLAHDGMQTCAGCFGEGRAPLPLVPARAVWMAEQRAKQAEAQLEAVSFQGWSACVQLLALQQEREEPKP